MNSTSCGRPCFSKLAKQFLSHFFLEFTPEKTGAQVCTFERKPKQDGQILSYFISLPFCPKTAEQFFFMFSSSKWVETFFF